MGFKGVYITWTCFRDVGSGEMKKKNKKKKQKKNTRLVRGSNYSPAFELCSRARKTMMGTNKKQDLVNVEVHTKFGQILSICSPDIEQGKITKTPSKFCKI